MPRNHAPSPSDNSSSRRATDARIWAALLAVVLALVTGLVGAAPAQAASQGAGFGTWAPTSAYGWHGSMLVGGVHTYCITPGAATPVGPSTDRGVTGNAAGLSPAQLTGINVIVTKYGQTTDPVQAAAVSWAVKAVADWNRTLHAYGYPGDSLAGAVNWTFSSLSPQHNKAIQDKAVAYYAEATRAKPVTSAARIRLTTDPAAPTSGTVRVDSGAAATGKITLTNAVFVANGKRTLGSARTGVAYPIRATPASEGAPVTVSASARFTAGPAAAVRLFTTPQAQDTAGPGGEVVLQAKTTDAAPRVTPFTPSITTNVVSPYAAGGAFTDLVEVQAVDGTWPRSNGGYAALRAEADVYVTDAAPEEGQPMPADASLAGRLELVTTAEEGPGAYRVASDWGMDRPGYYTAVWTIRRENQSDEVASRLARGYSWTERWGVPSQIVMVPDITTKAQAEASTGGSISDTIVVRGPIPAGGVTLTGSVYRAVDGVAPADTCVPENLIWTSEPVAVSTPGETVVTSPGVETAGTYYWQERAVDTAGRLVHLGACGIENETSRVSEPAPSPSPTPTPDRTPNPTPTMIPPAFPPSDEPSATPGALPATGLDETTIGPLAGGAALLLAVGAALIAMRRRRFGAQRPIG